MTDLLLRQKMPKFGPSEIFRLRHSLVALVEELKFHKKCELDNEFKIQDLVTRNHAMHKEWDTERQKARLKEEGFERAIKELKLEYENKLRRLDVDQRQKNVKNECKLFAKDSMKEDMRQLQMTIFHQEKTIKELETKLQAQESSSERAVSQWAGVEDKVSNLTEIYQHTLDSVSRLQRDVVQAVSLNQKLSARNHHHECLMQEKVSEMGRLQQELLQVKIEASAPSLDACELQELRGTVGGLHARIHMLETQGQKQNEALTEQTERARLATSNLQTAQQLVTRHLDKAAKHRAEASKLSAECAALTAQCSALKEQLNVGQGSLVERDMAIKTAMEDWQQQASQLKAVITSKDVQLQALEHSRRQLEEANNKLVDSNEQLHQRLVQAKNTVCVSTSDIGLLAGNSVLSMTDISLQVSPDVRSIATQTSPHMKTTPTQYTVDVKPPTSHTSPAVNTVTRYAPPAGNTARATQTSEPPVGHDVHQSHSHETVPSCVQIDAATTCPTSAQTIPPFRANTAAGTAHSFSNNAASTAHSLTKSLPSNKVVNTAHSLTKSLPRVAVDPHMLALASFLDTLQGRHEATIQHTPAQTIQLVSESMTADQTPATLTKSPSGVASDPHASDCVQGKSQRYQLEASTSPGSAYAQPAVSTSSMSAHMAHTFTTSQARDGAQYRSADQELLDKCVGQARDGAQYRSADQELLDKCQGQARDGAQYRSADQELLDKCVGQARDGAQYRSADQELLDKCQGQARDGAQYRSADQELLDKCVRQARDGAQYRSADQELLDNYLESHEIVRCLLTAEPTPMFTTKNTPVQDRHQSPPQVDTAGSDFVSSQDKHPAFDNTESSTNITQTAGQYNQEVEQYNQEAAGIQKFDLPISVTLSYTTHIQKDEVKQLTCVDSTRVSHAVADDVVTGHQEQFSCSPQHISAESRTAHGIAEWKQTSPPAPSDMVRHSSQEADRSCSNMGSAVCSSDDRDTAGRDGDFDFVNIKQETCTNQVDVSLTWRDRPSLQGEVCQVDVSQMWCDRPSRQGEVCQVSTNMSSWCCSSTKDEPSLPHRESQFDGPANTISKFDNNNSGKTDSSETLKMRDNISDDEENITKTVMETLPWPDSTDHDDKINMNIDETLPWPDSTDHDDKINMNIDETLPWPDSTDNNEKINMNSDETLPWPDSTDNDVKMNMEIGETHTWPDRTQDDDKIGIDLSQASILQDSTVHLDKMNVNDTHTSIDGTQDDDKMNVNETHTSTDGTQDDDKMNVNDTHTSIDGTQDDDKMNVNETHTSTDGTHDNNDGKDMNVTMACVLIDKRHDDDDDRINVSETDILTDTTNDDTTARIPVSEGPVFLDGTERWMAAGRFGQTDKPSRITERWMAAGIFQQTDKPSRISRAAFSDTGNTHPAILDPTQCSHMSLSSGVLNVAHATADNLSVCTTPTSNIPLENVGGDQYLNVVPGDILPTRDCGFGTTRRHAMPIKTPRWHLMRKRVRKISLPQSVFTVNVHPHSSVTADYKIIYDHDGTASIQESSLPAQTDSNVTASRRAQVSDIADNCVTAVESLHSSRACVAMGVPAPATSYIQHPTSYVANVSGSAGLSHLAEHTVSSKQAKKLTQNASRPDQGQARDPYDFSAAEDVWSVPGPKPDAPVSNQGQATDVWSVPGSKLDAPASNQGRTRDVYAFHTAENLVSSQTAKRTSSDTRAAPRSLRLAKPGRISGTRSLACLKSPLLLSLGVSSSMVSRTDVALSNTPSPDVAPSNTSSPVLLKSQPLARAADALMPSQVHVETEPSSCSRMVCDMAGHISRLQCSQQTSSAGSANCQQLLSNQSSQHVTDETSQHLTTLTSQVLTNQTSSCGSHISDNCSSQIKSSDTVTTSSLVCRGNEKTSAENSPDDHTNPPPESSQQKGISPESSQQKGISPESSQQKGISPESSQQKGISPESSQQKGISPESSQQKGISPESSQQKGISPESSQQKGISPESSQQKGISPESSQQKGISPESSQQKGISLESSQQKGISPESSQQKGISPESSQQKGISPESSQQKGISPESSQQKGISLESSQVQSQSEHTTQPGEMDRDWPVLLSHTSTARSISHTVVSTRDAVKSDNKLKGILKGPYCRRPKSVPSKCVRFRLGLVQQLKHGLAQDRQPPGTPFQRGVNSSSSCDDIGSSGYNISAPAADPSGSTAKLEVSSQNDPKSRSQHKQGNSTGQATSDTDPKSCSQHKKGNSIGQATSDTDPKSCSQHKKSNFIGQATSDTDPKSCSQHKGNSIGQTTSCYTDPKSSNEHTHGNSSSLATDGDPNTNDQNKYAISSLAMSSHTDHSSTGQRTCGNSSSLATSSHTGPKMSGQYNCDKSHTDHSSTGQHTYDICKSPAAKSDPNPRDRNRYGNCRSLAVPAHVDPSSSSQLTYCNSTYLTNSRSPARPPTVSTSWDPSAPEAWTRPILIVPESPPLQLSSMEQEILSTPEDAPAGSQSPDTILSSHGSPYARTHVFENINSSSRVQNDVQSPAAKKQKIW